MIEFLFNHYLIIVATASCAMWTMMAYIAMKR